jgi:SAM-dependent methyltransferase
MSGVDDPIGVVRDGYDRLDGIYRDWIARMPDGPRAGFVSAITRLVPVGSDVLELGCGPGTDAAALADGRRYTGVHLSEVQLTHARDSAPQGALILDDFFTVELPPASFDAVVALYSFAHVPAAWLGELLDRVRSWLRPGGWLCASFGASDEPGSVEPMWLGGADMYFSSLPPERTDQLLLDAGFTIRSAETITELEPGHGPATFHWVIARAPTDEETPR